MNAYFAIVAREDNPLFEAEFFRPDYLTKLENEKCLHQFIAHAALDMVDALMWTNNGLYLKVVDRYAEWFVSAFIATTGDRFLLLHDVRNEDSVRQFFSEAHELYVKYTVNPFYKNGSPVQSGSFEVKIRLLAKRFLEK
ncbi:hypothetical protein PSACC_02754 [Paramicrosporidium saccamoebae]|uniref:Trafficking protein particle complex subunit 2 n=1 Tax=Paramicrosporidium saccamoebae TaxID=1246581 RepID=A0A2H9TI76_9FUNG|nr:hypothetical protein PSACC_02754 [Paramicrosporidium saccamoebae]